MQKRKSILLIEWEEFKAAAIFLTTFLSNFSLEAKNKKQPDFNDWRCMINTYSNILALNHE